MDSISQGKNKQKSDKNHKIIIDFCILAIFIALFATGDHGRIAHMVFGIIIIPMIVLHLLLNKKWIKTAANLFSGGKLKNKMKKMFYINVGLCIAFVILIVSGIMMYGINVLAHSHVLHGLHSLSSKIFAILSIWHIKLHWRYLVNHFKKTGANKNPVTPTIT